MRSYLHWEPIITLSPFVDPLISRCRLCLAFVVVVTLGGESAAAAAPLPPPSSLRCALASSCSGHRQLIVGLGEHYRERVQQLGELGAARNRSSVNLGVAPLVHLEGIFGISVVSLRATLSPLLSHFLEAAARLSTFVGHPPRSRCCDNLRTCEVRGINH